MVSKTDSGREARWHRRQEKIYATNQKSWNNFLKSTAGRSKQAGDITGLIVKSLGISQDKLYGYFERQAVRADLPKIRAEAQKYIEESGGVLIACITRMEAIPVGFQPYYIGLRVVGGGLSELSALKAYVSKSRDPITIDPKKCTADNISGSPLACRITGDYQMVCVPTNPTGETRLHKAEFKAAPKGFNYGYARQVAAKVNESFAHNLRNIGEITFGSAASPVQYRSYIKENLLYYSKEEWDKIWQSSRN